MQAEIKKPDLQAKLGEIVLGPEGSLRRSLPETGLSADQQVDALIERVAMKDEVACFPRARRRSSASAASPSPAASVSGWRWRALSCASRMSS